MRDGGKISSLAFNEMGRSGIIISFFFSAYQITKCALLGGGITAPEVRVGGATAVSLLPMQMVPTLRRLTPYCLTLVAVDSYHTYYATDVDGSK